MKYSFHPDAKKELNEATNYYEKQKNRDSVHFYVTEQNLQPL